MQPSRRPSPIALPLRPVPALAPIVLAAIVPAAVALAAALALALAGSPLAAAAEAGDAPSWIIEPGHEDVIQAAVAPFAVDRPVADGYSLTSISIARGAVTYELTRPGDPADRVRVAVSHTGGQTPRPDTGGPDTGVLAVSLTAGPTLSAAEARAVAAPLVERIAANHERLAAVWVPREGHGAEPAHVGGRGAPPPPDEPPRRALPDEDVQDMATVARRIFTAEHILIGVAVLLGLMVLASGLPAFLRRRRR